MKKLVGIVSVIVLVTMLLPIAFVPKTNAAQPPLDTNTFWEGTIGWGPGRADPQRVYDTGSGQLVFNSYEGLIAWNGDSYYTFKPVLATNVPDRESTSITVSNTSAVNDLIYDATWTGGYTSKGYYDLYAAAAGFSQGDVIYLMDGGGVYRAWYVKTMVGTYTLTLERYWYTFHIRTSPTINFYVWGTGAVYDTFDINDAIYTFKRGLCQDTGPQWMFSTAMFGTFNSAGWNSNATGRKNSIDYAHLVDSAVEASGTDLIMNLGMPFPDNAFKQCLSNTWGCVGSKTYALDNGCWDDSRMYELNAYNNPYWFNSSICWHRSRNPLDTTGALKWCGTGPYYVAVFDPVGLKIDMVRNDAYWGGWPAAGCNGSIQTYEIKYIADWTTRKTEFLAGDIDTCAVPRANMFELLQAPNTNAEPILIGGKPVLKTIKNIVPSISMDALHPTFVVTDTSAYIGTGHFPDGVPIDFFNNTAVRKAFAYSFDAIQYGIDSYYGEADYRKNWLAAGLYPDYYDPLTQGGYGVKNFTAAENALKAAIFNGTSVWNSGFTLTLTYNTGNDMRRIACEMIRDFFVTLSTYDGRSNPNGFVVNVLDIDWNVYLDQWENYELPIWSIGWLADFADADNFARPYMHSYGDFSGYQLYSVDNGWGLLKDSLLDEALTTADGPARQALYTQLANIYYNDAVSIPITCPRGRRWCQYWVKGWYYDALYPAFYMRNYWKQDDCWYDVTGPTKYVSDGITNMRDIQYLIAAFNAKAPQPGLTTDPRWNGNYGANGGVDPSGDRLCNMRDIQGAILHFNHKINTAEP